MLYFSDLCQGVECQWGARCEAGECVCPTNCGNAAGIHMSEPVCASNMVTYPNECELQRASCSQPPGVPPLTVIFYGDCREKNAVPASMLHAFHREDDHVLLLLQFIFIIKLQANC
jgi:coxsackievirus/adenovirus receptor